MTNFETLALDNLLHVGGKSVYELVCRLLKAGEMSNLNAISAYTFDFHLLSLLLVGRY
jgi:hypothetical protein